MQVCLYRQHNTFFWHIQFKYISFLQSEQHETSLTIVWCVRFPYCVVINICFFVAGLALLLETRTAAGCHMELVSVFLQLCSKSITKIFKFTLKMQGGYTENTKLNNCHCNRFPTKLSQILSSSLLTVIFSTFLLYKIHILCFDACCF